MYIYGIGLIYKIDVSDNPYYYHYNVTGHTIAITDASENIVNKYFYTPSGILTNKIEAIVNPFCYVGKYGVFDDGNGLFYMRARYYDPDVGRFVTKDPIGFEGGINQYAYADNNPINRFDISGFVQIEIIPPVNISGQPFIDPGDIGFVQIEIEPPVNTSCFSESFLYEVLRQLSPIPLPGSDGQPPDDKAVASKMKELLDKQMKNYEEAINPDKPLPKGYNLPSSCSVEDLSGLDTSKEEKKIKKNFSY